MRAIKPAFLLVVLLACATVPFVDLDEGGGVGDSVRWKTFQLLAAGDIAGAGEYYLLATGATQLPRWMVALQRAFDAANRVAGPCEKVADDILEGFKRLGQNPTLVRFTTTVNSGAGGRISFDLEDGTNVQVSIAGYHVAVRCGERIYDAFTGPTGMLLAD